MLESGFEAIPGSPAPEVALDPLGYHAAHLQTEHCSQSMYLSPHFPFFINKMENVLGPLFFFQVYPNCLVYVKGTIIQNVCHMAFRILKIRVRRHLTQPLLFSACCVGANARWTVGGDKACKA